MECILKQKFTVNKRENKKSSIQSLLFWWLWNSVPNPKKIDPNIKTLIIFNDIIELKNKIIKNYYTREKHNIDCFYISQKIILNF